MKDLLELKEKTEKDINELYQILQNIDISNKGYHFVNKRYLDKLDFLKLINIIYQMK